jgi:hypothetical protein
LPFLRFSGAARQVSGVRRVVVFAVRCGLRCCAGGGRRGTFKLIKGCGVFGVVLARVGAVCRVWCLALVWQCGCSAAVTNALCRWMWHLRPRASFSLHLVACRLIARVWDSPTRACVRCGVGVCHARHKRCRSLPSVVLVRPPRVTVARLHLYHRHGRVQVPGGAVEEEAERLCVACAGCVCCVAVSLVPGGVDGRPPL